MKAKITKTCLLLLIGLIVFLWIDVTRHCSAEDGNYKKKKVIGHYVQWFKHRLERKKIVFDHWNWQGVNEEGKPIVHNPEHITDEGLRDISSVYSPLIGPYDSADEEVIEYHVLTAKALGIDGFVVDWYGPNNSVNENFQKLIKIAQKYDFEAGICYEEKITFPDYQYPKDRKEALQLALKNMQYVIDQYGEYSNYLKFNNHPLVLMFLGHGNWKGFGPKTFNEKELIQIIELLKKNNWVFVREHWMNGFEKLRAGFEWVGDESYHDWFQKTLKDKRNKNSVDLVIGMVNPGFDDTGVWGWGGGPRIKDRENGERYKKFWDTVYENEPEMVQIVTWNDFEEGTVIEPTYDDRFIYANKTEEYIAQYNGSKVNLDDNVLPFKLFQLRKFIRKTEIENKEQYNKRLNNIAENFLKMSNQILEQRLMKIAKELKYEFINYYDAEDEYEVYLNVAGEEKMVKVFSSEFNLAQNRKIEASYDKDGLPRNAIDGDISTRWASKFEDDEWYMINLGKEKEISCIIIDWEAAFGKEYLIQVSQDKKSWQAVFHEKAGEGGLKIIEFKPIKTKYVRFKGIKRGTGWGYSFWEFGVFANNPW